MGNLMPSFWLVFTVVYVCGMIAYGYYVVSSLDPRFYAIAQRGPSIAAGMALSLLGSSLLWPLAVAVVVFFRYVNIQPVSTDVVYEVEDIFDKGPLDEATDVEPLVCASCRQRQQLDRDDGTAHWYSGGMLTRHEFVSAPANGPADLEVEMYWLCDDCFEAIADRLDESAMIVPAVYDSDDIQGKNEDTGS